MQDKNKKLAERIIFLVGVLGIEPRGSLAPVKNLSTPPLIIIQLLKKKSMAKLLKDGRKLWCTVTKENPE